jgi:hypothetical protein
MWSPTGKTYQQYVRDNNVYVANQYQTTFARGGGGVVSRGDCE